MQDFTQPFPDLLLLLHYGLLMHITFPQTHIKLQLR